MFQYREIVKSRWRDIECWNIRVALKFDRHVGSGAGDVPVKFQSDRTILNPNPAASRQLEMRVYGARIKIY